MHRINLKIIAIVVISSCFACSDNDDVINHLPSTTIDQLEYFGDIMEIGLPVAISNFNNENAQALNYRVNSFRSYMGSNKERLSIKPWHNTDNIDLIVENDSIHSDNSASSFDGVHLRQISQHNGWDYFWKTDLWFLFSGVADTIMQRSDKSQGHHGFMPPSVDGFYDNINWYRTEDSLVITVKRSGGYPRFDESIWINTTTQSGKFYFLNQESYPNRADLYRWDENGNGTYHTVDDNGIETLIDSW